MKLECTHIDLKDFQRFKTPSYCNDLAIAIDERMQEIENQLNEIRNIIYETTAIPIAHFNDGNE